MSKPTDKADELIDLLGAAWDGRLDESSFSRLEELLSEEGSRACEILVKFSKFQVELTWLAASSAAHERALSLLQSHFSEATAVNATSESNPVRHKPAAPLSIPWRRSRVSVTRRRIAFAAAVLLPLAALCWVMLKSAPVQNVVVERIHLVRAPYKVARLIAVDDAEWEGGVERAVGDLFSQQDRLILKEGTAHISMALGADVLLQGPCSVQLVSAGRMRLEQGKLTAQVASWAKGFVVDAEGLQITDLGTRFAVSAAPAGEVEAHVLEGMVKAESIATGAAKAPLTLKAGQAVRWDRADKSLHSIPADPSRFASTLDQFRPLRLIGMADTGRGLRVGSRDPRWQITAGHVSGGSFPAQAIVGSTQPYMLEEPFSPNLPNSVRGNSQWVSVLGGVSRGVPAHAAFTFETRFDLTGVDPETVHLMGQVLVDNRVQEIRLNGKPLSIAPFEIFRIEDFQRFHVIEIADGFIEGINRIEFDVINGTIIGGADNPMALRVEWQGFGQVGG